jgi:FtsH-binding integral membrane protein
MNKLYSDTFRWLAIGLLVTFISGVAIASTPSLLKVLVSNSLMFYLPIIVQLGICIALAGFIRKLSYHSAVLLFLGYSLLTGIDIAFYLIIFELTSVISIFFVAAFIFAIMAFLGKVLDVDVSKLGTILFIALIGIIIVPIINVLFIHSDSLSLMVSCIAIVIFMGYIIYDLKIVEPLADEIGEEKASIYCAFQLYLDFINLFIRLLQIFGKRRD